VPPPQNKADHDQHLHSFPTSATAKLASRLSLKASAALVSLHHAAESGFDLLAGNPLERAALSAPAAARSRHPSRAIRILNEGSSSEGQAQSPLPQDVDPARARTDLEAWLPKLHSKGLVRILGGRHIQGNPT
jgi:hypothetical protein